MAGYLFLIVVGQEIPEDFKLQISDSFRFAVKEYQGNSPNTLFVKIGTEGNDANAAFKTLGCLAYGGNSIRHEWATLEQYAFNGRRLVFSDDD